MCCSWMRKDFKPYTTIINSKFVWKRVWSNGRIKNAAEPRFSMFRSNRPFVSKCTYKENVKKWHFPQTTSSPETPSPNSIKSCKISNQRTLTLTRPIREVLSIAKMFFSTISLFKFKTEWQEPSGFSTYVFGQWWICLCQIFFSAKNLLL